MMGWMYLLKFGEVSRGFILIFALVNTLLLLAYRLAGRRLRRVLRQEMAAYRYHVIVGTGPRAVEVARMIEANEDFGNKVLAFVRERPGAELPADLTQGDLRRPYPLHRSEERRVGKECRL